MSPTRKRIGLLHLSGKFIRTTADHPLYVQGRGWVSAAEMPGAKSDGEQEVVYHLNLGEPAMPDQPRPNYPIVGFVAGTPLLTADGLKRIEDIKPGDMIQVQPGDMIQVQPGDDQTDDEPHAHDDQGDDEPRWWERN